MAGWGLKSTELHGLVVLMGRPVISPYVALAGLGMAVANMIQKRLPPGIMAASSRTRLAASAEKSALPRD